MLGATLRDQQATKRSEMTEKLSPLTRRRLTDGARALALQEPSADLERWGEAMRGYVLELGDAVAAMQSLDDLGSPEANKQAWDDMQKLQKRWVAAKRKLDGSERRSPAA
jgi:hypothetical protein